MSAPMVIPFNPSLLHLHPRPLNLQLVNLDRESVPLPQRQTAVHPPWGIQNLATEYPVLESLAFVAAARTEVGWRN